MLCFLQLQMVPLQSNVDVGSEVLRGDSPLLLSSCILDRQFFPKNLHMSMSVLSQVRRDCCQTSP